MTQPLALCRIESACRRLGFVPDRSGIQGRLRLIALGSILASCAHGNVTVGHTTTRGGDDAFVIGCEESPIYCKEQARELCPFGETTLEQGIGGWYAPGEDARQRHEPRSDRRLFKLERWVIRCVQPAVGGGKGG